MKTKFVKVSVSEKLPALSEYYESSLGLQTFSKVMDAFIASNGDIIYPEYWFEEVPDREQEMIELLQDLVNLRDGSLLTLQDKAKQLLNDLKQTT
jgi:hypothetical protein